MADLVEKLKEIGFNTYEAKVYIALLKKYPATGYEVSKLANIPQSRTYDTLKVLEEKKVVVSANTKPVTYTPIRPKQLTSSYGENFTKKQAQYAVDNVDADWNENALKKAEDYRDTMSMSKSAIYDQLTSSYGEGFTSKQAKYAINNLD